MGLLSFENYVTSGDNSHPLIGDLTARLAAATAAPVAVGPGWAKLSDGTTVDWRDMDDRPHRRRGWTTLTDPRSFGEFVSRSAVEETAIYADKMRGAVTAVFNDNPAVSRVEADHLDKTEGATLGQVTEEDAAAGRRDYTATLELVTHEEWTAWSGKSDRGMPQRAFGEFLEEMAHNVVEPASASMVEIATTLTMKQKIDYDSRVRLDNGDQSFRFETDSTMRAGRESNIEIPTKFTISVPFWEGTDPVLIDARLRVRANADGVQMTYKLMRTAEARDAAFSILLDQIRELIPANVPIFHGSI